MLAAQAKQYIHYKHEKGEGIPHDNGFWTHDFPVVDFFFYKDIGYTQVRNQELWGKTLKYVGKPCHGIRIVLVG